MFIEQTGYLKIGKEDAFLSEIGNLISNSEGLITSVEPHSRNKEETEINGS